MWELDDAIRHYEFLAEDTRNRISLDFHFFEDNSCLEANNDSLADEAFEYECLVAWLKELRELRKITGESGK